MSVGTTKIDSASTIIPESGFDACGRERKITTEQLHSLWKAGKIVIPEYQRREVWTSAMKHGFICAILDKEQAIPPITVHEKGDKWEVVDGQQRITAIRDYMEDKLALTKPVLQENGLDIKLKGKFSKLPASKRQDFLKFTLNYNTTDNPRKTFLRLQVSKPLNDAERNHAREGALNNCLSELVHDYAALIEHSQFDNKRYRAEEVFMGCLFIAAQGRSAKTKKEHRAFYNNFDLDANEDTIETARRILSYMMEAIGEKQQFLGAANFRALFLLFLKTPETRLAEIKPLVNNFLLTCTNDEQLASARNRLGEEHQQKDAIQDALLEYCRTTDESALSDVVCA